MFEFGLFSDQITKDDVKVYAAVLDKPSADVYPSTSKWYECVASKLASRCVWFKFMILKFVFCFDETVCLV